MNYTALGATATLAARLEELNKNSIWYSMAHLGHAFSRRVHRESIRAARTY